jgi:hypothetical protein
MFACHYVGTPGVNYYTFQSFDYAENNGLKLRVDSVASAVVNLMTYAGKPGVAMFPNQYRFGVYPFIAHAIDAVPLDYLSKSQQNMFLPTNNFGNNSTLANTYLDRGWTDGGPKASDGTAIGDGGTHFENLWPDMQKYLRGSGTGMSWSPKGVIFLVTDGADNSLTFTPSNFPIGFSVSNPLPAPTGGSSDLCQSAKDLGYTVAVLLIPYATLPYTPEDSTFFGAEVVQAQGIAAGNPSQIKARMQACASSPAFYAEASSDGDISAALQNLFTQATQQIRLTQ